MRVRRITTKATMGAAITVAIFQFVLAGFGSTAEADTSTASVVAFSYQIGATSIYLSVAIPTSVDSAARAGQADWLLKAPFITYTDVNGQRQLAASGVGGVVSIAYGTTLQCSGGTAGCPVAASTDVIQLTYLVGNAPLPGNTPDFQYDATSGPFLIGSPPVAANFDYVQGDPAISVFPAVPKTVYDAAQSGSPWDIDVTVLYVDGNGAISTVDSGPTSIQNGTYFGAQLDPVTDLIGLNLQFGSTLPGNTPSFVFTATLTGPPDSTPPTITLTTPPDAASYVLHQTVSADYSCADEAGGSGLAACVGTVANGAAIDTGSVGPKTFTVDAADNAGNTSSVTHHYTVAYDFSGFLSPVVGPPAVNTGKAGRTYPIKWQLIDANGVFISSLSSVTGVSVQSTSCANFTSDPTDTMSTSTTGGTGLRYDSTGNDFVYNWATKSKGCFSLFLELDSGQTFAAFFTLS